MIDRYSMPKMKKIWSDTNKYSKWLKVELAVCEAWSEQGIIPSGDMAKLRRAKFNSKLMNDAFAETRHDVTAFLHSITSTLGDEGRWIHLGLTSSDVIDTGLSLQMMEAIELLIEGVSELIDVIHQKSIAHKNTLMIGRTHGIHAEPTSFGLKLGIWWTELQRHRNRLITAKEDISVGKISGAVGTHATVPPAIQKSVCKRLGLRPAPISSQIIQRDRHAHYVNVIALTASSLEKFATEIRTLQRTEIRELEEPFGDGQTGSSAMPHKRNPELSERVCGLSRLIRGHSVTALENIALWNERDISHSSAERIILPDSCMALDYMMHIFKKVMKGLIVNTERMRENLENTKGLIFSQRIMLHLIDKGLSRVEAYKTVQTHAMEAWNKNKNFRELIISDSVITKHTTSSELDKLFDYGYYLRYVDEIYKHSGLIT